MCPGSAGEWSSLQASCRYDGEGLSKLFLVGCTNTQPEESSPQLISEDTRNTWTGCHWKKLKRYRDKGQVFFDPNPQFLNFLLHCQYGPSRAGAPPNAHINTTACTVYKHCVHILERVCVCFIVSQWTYSKLFFSYSICFRADRVSICRLTSILLTAAWPYKA